MTLGGFMCTGVFKNYSSYSYFGRNLDLNIEYNESIILTPRNYPIRLRSTQDITKHYAIYGIGIIQNNYPLYFDCVNEVGLAFSGLNFPGNAFYFPINKNKINVSAFELPLYLLAESSSIKEVKEKLKKINLCDVSFSSSIPLSPLHFLVADKTSSIVIEQTKEGLKVYDNPYGVLTNNPPFSYHTNNISNYLHLSNREPSNLFNSALPLKNYSKAMGAIGLPGDSSSSSRFIKASFLLNNCDLQENNDFNVLQMMHVLNNVSTLKGECILNDESREYTLYSVIYNLNKNEIYLRTYEDNSINKYVITKGLNIKKLTQININKKINFNTTII